jgi:hypothetical protein
MIMPIGMSTTRPTQHKPASVLQALLFSNPGTLHRRLRLFMQYRIIICVSSLKENTQLTRHFKANNGLGKDVPKKRLRTFQTRRC